MQTHFIVANRQGAEVARTVWDPSSSSATGSVNGCGGEGAGVDAGADAGVDAGAGANGDPRRRLKVARQIVLNLEVITDKA